MREDVPASRIAHWLREARYFALDARRARGRRHAPAWWEQQYRAGRWEYLDGASELAHYMVIVGYILHFHPAPAILDVGCGHGRLFELLGRHIHAGYLGIDIAPEAVRQARERVPGGARFVVSDFEQFAPSEQFDVIVFNESLYYAPEPVALLEKYSRALTTNGVLVVSMCHNWWQAPIWSAVARRFAVLHSTEIRNEHGQTWHVRALR